MYFIFIYVWKKYVLQNDVVYKNNIIYFVISKQLLHVNLVSNTCTRSFLLSLEKCVKIKL